MLALWWLAALTVAGLLIFHLGYFGGAMVPTDNHAYEIFEKTGQPPVTYPRFNALVYSI
jgi:hypothetical protein